MDSSAFVAWQFVPLFDAAAAAFATLAAYVTLDLARRLPAVRGGVAWAWLFGAGLSLGTGMSVVHFITLAGHPLPFPIAYGGWLSLAGAALGIAASVFGIGLASGRDRGLPARVAAATLIAVAATAAMLLYLFDLRVAPALEWRFGDVLVAVLGLSAAFFAGGVLTRGQHARSLPRRSLAALIAGVAIVAAQRITTMAAQVPIDAVSLHEGGLFNNAAMALLTAIGGLSLLSMLLLLSVIEARMRRALRAAVHRIEQAARTDSLTQLPNRSSFDQRLDAVAHQGGRGPLAVLFIGLDNFKQVNDSFGRRIGDLLLQQMAQRLAGAVGGSGMLARVGGDEFVFLLEKDAERGQVAAMAQQLLERIAEPADVEGRPVAMTASIGLTLCPRDGTISIATVHAEAAARFAKRNGGATFAFFEPNMLGDARDQVDLLRDLRQAVARKELELYYQPKVHAPSGEITGVEALLRWHHPQRGMVSPAVFVPLAERHGLIGTIGQWVIDEACRQAREWRDQGLRMRVAINLSVHQLRQPDIADRVAAALARHNVNPQLLTCEITESVAMEDAEGTRRIFDRLAAVGVHLSIDDFGTGYCNFAILRKLPADELKIDRSFVLDLETSADARAVVDAVVKLAQALGRKVVAEGVETEAQSQVLRSLGCDVLQGYLFAKPMSAKALMLWAMKDVGPRPIDFRASLFEETLPSPLH
jgi:diguanylate cyclase (GGDEF)-like protein